MYNIRTCPFHAIRGASLLLFLWLTIGLAHGQTAEPWITWDEFAEEFLGRGDEDISDDTYEMLEELASNPLNINTASREQLLDLPFLSEAIADSILSYRERVGGFASKGELMFVSGTDYAIRRYLSLFIKVEPLQLEPVGLKKKLLSGRTEIEGRIDIPFYRREGDRNFKPGEKLHDNNRVFLGQPVGGILRYRYRWRRNLRYGLTLQHDRGEPFAARGNIPFDYTSAYFWSRSNDERTDIIFGDYRLSWGQGLVMGHRFMNSFGTILDAPRRTGSIFAPHTSGEENNFLRGGAILWRVGSWRLAGFASYRTLDARIEGDTVRSLLTTGLHRTDVEIQRKDAVGMFVAGAHAELGGRGWDIGMGTFFGHYSKPISPEPRKYSKYYFRGDNLAAFSLHWNIRRSRHWAFAGEAAADAKLHLAVTNTIYFRPHQELTLTLQHRNISSRFVAPFGATFQDASRVSNEHGIMLGVRYVGLRRLALRAYADAFYFPKPTYYCNKSSRGLELLAEGAYEPSSRVSLLFRYKMKTRQRNVTGRNIIDYSYRHRWRMQGGWKSEKLDIYATLDATLAGRQTDADKWGRLVALRCTWRPAPTWQAKAFAALFYTDAYDAAVYAYEPRLLHSFGTSAFYYHGMRLVALGECKITPALTLSASAGWTKYFNVSTTGQGADMVSTSSRPSLSVQLRYVNH